MNLTGDEGGIAALKEMNTSNKTYLQFLLQEARTVFERRVDFKSKDGVAYRLTWFPQDGKFVVTRADAPAAPGA